MENKDFEISLEYAKDNNFTCKITKDNKKTYLYSKYYPKKGLCEDLNEKLDENKNYIVLGLGLGYELEELQKRTTGKIYVIDYNKCFYNIIKENEKLSSVISNENTIFLFGDDYKSLNINFEFELYSLEKIIILNSKFFM